MTSGRDEWRPTWSDASPKRHGRLSKQPRVLIVTHTDIDGYLSGYLLWNHLKSRDPTVLTMNYNDPFPWNMIDDQTEVWMSDFSLQPWSDMTRLQKECRELIWIDHHKTAIQNYDEYVNQDGQPIKGLRLDGRAACGLCWDYCYSHLPEPQAVHLAERYDVWQWQDVPGALEFQYGTKFYQTDPSTEEGRTFWYGVLRWPDQQVKKIIEEGKLLMKYKERSNSSYMKDNCFETQLDGLKVIAVNRAGNSQQFNSIYNPTKHHAMLAFFWAKGIWTVSLYSDREDVDVGAIAKNHGGGGHKGASGFQTKNLPFELR